MKIIRDQIHNILTRNATTNWKEKIGEFMNGNIGNLKFAHFISQEFKRMEDELVLQCELWIKQKESADIKPIWEDNLRTKALLLTLLEKLEGEEEIFINSTAEVENAVAEKGEV